ncbi:hypothetical protein MNV49_002432 [Pseudohyphozyma bogoriensis]|nr:hypothetical protein MNV49_002432 [Pseudohyphozyma bogoriensis]
MSPLSGRVGIPFAASEEAPEYRQREEREDLTPCPTDLADLSSQLAADVERATKKEKQKIPAIKSDGSRGGHEIRQIVSVWSLADALAKVNLHFLFGAFASFCLNTGGKVACLPHRDYHNLGLCGIIPFGNFDSSRSAWVLLHEPKVAVEVGPGDVFFFPSAVFTHSNTPVHEDDDRNSLAFWCGASLFLWQECGSKAFNELSKEEQEQKLDNMKSDWRAAWERFPVL